MDEKRFADCLDRIRSGDADAAAELLSEFEPQIRRLVRLRLVNSNMRRVLDSTDICQSVFANFFERMAAGHFEVDSPEQLFALLATMARNKLTQRYRSETARRPKAGRSLFYGEMAIELDRRSIVETPSHDVILEELIERYRNQLTQEECELAELRRNGNSWESIGERFGKPPEALRKRLDRAIARIVGEIEMED